jgi:DNA uptake protein ComE-like DNA-binding protein
LQGIGPVTAAKIISGRPYREISDLTSQKIVGASVFEKIKNQISVH